ncbi:YrrS family protein [Desemzia sp. FAM 23991]|uniref:YrrS family protein n=1 Tax=unclassified Desemzia TaxID=2685243 RepID=UPI003887B379
MKDPKKPTRTNNRSTNNKEQSLTRKITIGLVIILILSLLFLAYTIFGGGGEEDENSFLDTSSESSSMLSESSEEETNSENSSESESSQSSESSSSASESSEEESSDSESEEPDDEAASGDWDPVGTEQSGEHTTNYSEGSQDRIEIKRASSVATGISEGDMIEWWVGNAGDQQVETVISNNAQTETYQVLLRWVDNQGWQPVQVEPLADNPYN